MTCQAQEEQARQNAAKGQADTSGDAGAAQVLQEL